MARYILPMEDIRIYETRIDTQKTVFSAFFTVRRGSTSVSPEPRLVKLYRRFFKKRNKIEKDRVLDS